MSKVFLLILSIAFETFVFTSVALAAGNEQHYMRVATCEVQGAKYAILDQNKVPLKPGRMYAAIENSAKNTYNLPTSLEISYQANSSFKLPSYWSRKEIPATACKQDTSIALFNVDEIIRDFYIKAYFIAGEPRPIDNIEDMVKNGSAIPLKLRVLCKSDELSDDVSLCKELTILDDIIPL